MKHINGEEALHTEIERRINDPLWEHRMARGVLRHRRRQWRFYTGIAAAAVLAFAGVGFAFYTKSSEPVPVTAQVQPINLDGFPYEEDQEISMLYDQDVYGE